MGKARWFDTHVHLERYAEAERRAIVERAANAGVVAMLCVSTTCLDSRRTTDLARDLWKAVGVHPKNAGEGLCLDMDGFAMAHRVVAVGEAGFDASGPFWSAQEAVFRAQCNLARRLGLALVLHIDGTGAWEQLVGAEDALQGLRVLRHYFTGNSEQARWHADRGHFVSFGRPLLREERLQEIAATVPPELLLIETDSYPSPGRSTEPKDLVEVGEALARLRGWTVEECAARLWENSCRTLEISPN